MLVSQSIPNFLGGISQLPDKDRPLGTYAAGLNVLPDITQGLSPRNPTEHIARLSPTPGAFSGAAVSFVDCGASGRYLVVIPGNGTLSMFNASTGAPVPVALEDELYAPDYLTGSAGFRTLLLGTRILVLNRGLSTALQSGGDFEVDLAKRTLVWVKESAPSTQYSLTIDGIALSYTTPATGDVSPAAVASGLRTALAANPTLAAKFPESDVNANSLAGSTLNLYSVDDYTVDGRDSLTGGGMAVIRGAVEALTDLPDFAPLPDITLRIAGDISSGLDDTFVRYEVGAGGTKGVWRETCKPGIPSSLERHTMPWVLEPTEGGFLFKRNTWESRLCGDDTSAPAPSFIGKPITEMAFYKNRLVFLSGESVNASASGDIFRFWRRTMTALLADDPIDVTSTFKDVAEFDTAVEWHDKLILTSPAGHLFALSGSGGLTPATVGIEHLASVSCTPGVRPVVFGTRLLVACSAADGWGRLLAFSYDEDGDKHLQHEDLTVQVPRLVDGHPVHLVADYTSGLVAIHTNAPGSNLYVLRDVWDGDKRLMSSWGVWHLDTGAPEDFLGLTLKDGTFHLVTPHTDGVYLERLSTRAYTGQALEDRVGHTATQPYTASVRLNTLYLRSRDGVADTEGRLQLRYLRLLHHGIVARVGVASPETGAQANTEANLPSTSGAMRVPVLRRNTEADISITTSGVTGGRFSLMGAEWEGFFTKRARSV